jgi:hypothetical protein
MTRILASSSTTVIASAALVLSGCAVGILLGRWTASQPQVASASATGAGPAELAPLLAEMRKLNETLQLQRETRGPVPTATPIREDASSHSDRSGELAAAINRLNDVLERTGDRGGGVRASIQKLKGEGYPSLDAMFQRVEALLTAGQNPSNDLLSSEMKQLHRLWTREDLFEHYGSPTQMSGTGGVLTVIYSRPKEPEGQEVVGFQTMDDLVTSIWYE